MNSTRLCRHDMALLPESTRVLSRERQLLIGAFFSGEYSLESAARFNPSMVPHPDQSEVADGALRFTSYRKKNFIHKFHEMGFYNDYANAVMVPLKNEFTRSDLNHSVGTVRHENQPCTLDLQRTLECIQWLADSNYEIRFSPTIGISERIIFPVSDNESNGIEDVRFVRFTEDDGSVMYSTTYTAYNGRAILPQLIETQDFLYFRVDRRRKMPVTILLKAIGMTPEQQSRVFERFYRADTSGKMLGTGLGMSIVHGIVDLHGGCLLYTSDAADE